ncbi:hypothetical protein ACFE04_018281 [Oxalis oulophora]
MASPTPDSDLSASFSEFVHVQGDFDQPTTLAPPTTNQSTLHIDSKRLKLRHRIGRGPFGDVWLATHHQATEDYDEYHEVALKMLHPIKEDHMDTVLDKLSDLLLMCRGIAGCCWLEGISVINGKICIVMKFYEGSIGDKLARLRGGKLSLPDVLRYGVDLAQGISELHSKGILVLNLKPFNFLLTETDQALLGDLGIPFLLLGAPLPSLDMARRLGTPNYMAPEQWKPEVRGPISFETDSWGFACSIIELLTGVQPWSGRSVDEIYNSVAKKQEKPLVPSGLPPPVENVLRGCFEYDFRSRPLMKDIIDVFERSKDGVENLVGPEGAIASNTGYTEWFLTKDHLQVGDTVRSRKPLNSGKSENMDIPEGIVVGIEQNTDRGNFVLVRVHGIHDPFRVHISTLERVTNGLTAGDWVHLKKEDKKHSPVGILHSIHRDGSVRVAFIGMEILWKGHSSELQMAEPYYVGQFIRLKSNVLSPRFEWLRKKACGAWATGRISRISPNGCLVVKFPGRLTFGDEHSDYLADPAEVEAVSFKTCSGMVKKYQHLEDFHWAVRPLLIALGLFTAMKMGVFVGKKMNRTKLKKHPQSGVTIQSNTERTDGQVAQVGGSAKWMPPSVANMLFREGGNATSSIAR